MLLSRAADLSLARCILISRLGDVERVQMVDEMNRWVALDRKDELCEVLDQAGMIRYHAGLESMTFQELSNQLAHDRSI